MKGYKEASIMVTVKHDDVTGAQLPPVFEWQGPIDGVVWINDLLYSVESLPFPLVPINLTAKFKPSHQKPYIRSDAGWMYTYHRLMGWTRGIERFSAHFQCKLILTLCVWGLGYCDPGVIPSWRCIGKNRGH